MKAPSKRPVTAPGPRSVTAAAAQVALWAAATLALAGCPRATPPCALYDCGGACVDVRVDAAHCGACGHACEPGAVCSGGACALACEAPLTECAGPAGARCASLRTDAADCGACGVACPAGHRCGDGTCVLDCQAGLAACGTGTGAWCADLARDRLNCGACGRACAPGATCAEGQCVTACDGPARAACDGACVDLFSDARHCGACGVACGPTQACDGATCRDACLAAGLARCGDGCADLAADEAHCGACGRACPGGATCEAGRCAAPACQGGFSLAGAPDLIGGVTTIVLRAGDVDGDGVPDLLQGEYEGTALWLARGLPAGGFAAPEVALAEPLMPNQLADMDGDGDLDVLAVSPDEVLWLQNDGAGRFTRGPAAILPEARLAQAVDLDGDGALDVVAAGSFVVSVWRAGLAGPSEEHFFFTIRGLAVLDADGDARPDLVVAGNALGILANQGDGTFVAAGEADAGVLPVGLAVADLDGDGRQDLLAQAYLPTTPSGDALVVVRGGPGGLGLPEYHPLPAVLHRYGTMAADVDGDGDLDVVLGEADAFRVFPNLGGGALGSPEVIPSSAAQSILALDADRDGRVDLVTGSAMLDGLEVRRRVPSGGWDGPTFLPDPPDQLVFADLDGDGRDDLVTLRQGDVQAGRPRAALVVRLGGPAGLGPPVTAEGFAWTGIQAGDLDGDGAAELLVLRGSAAPCVVRWRDGALQPEVPVVLPGMVGDLRLADVTGDGRLDLVAQGASWPHLLAVAPGLGGALFGAPVTSTPLPDGSTALTLVDLDGDGRADLVSVSGFPPSELELRPGRPDGTFGEARTLHVTLPGDYPTLRGRLAADLDQDGRLELAVGLTWVEAVSFREVGAVAVFQVEGGALTAAVTPSRAAPYALVAAPARADGRRELVLRGWNRLSTAEVRPDGTLGPEARWSGPSAEGDLALGDVDGDLRPDLVVRVAWPVPGSLLLYRGGCLP